MLGLQRERTNILQALKESESELSGLAFKRQNQLSPLERNVIDVDQTLIENEARRELAVTAPETGVLTAVIAELGQRLIRRTRGEHRAERRALASSPVRAEHRCWLCARPRFSTSPVPSLSIPEILASFVRT